MKKKENTNGIIYGIAIIIGIVIIIAGIKIQSSNTKFLKNAIKTKATITKITINDGLDDYLYDDLDDYSDKEVNHDVYVSFVVDGKTYGGNLGEWNSDMYEGKKITVYYNENNPNEFRGKSAKSVGYIVILFGGILLIASVAELVTKMKEKNN